MNATFTPERYDELLRALDAPQVMIWATNENHLCVYGSRALLDYCGVEEVEMLGLKWMELAHPDYRESLRLHQIHCFQQKYSFRAEYRVRMRDGSYHWVLDAGVPRFDGAGKFQGYIGSVVDIDDQKRQEEELRDRQRFLEKEILEISDREKSRLGRDLHDELCQELLSLAMETELLEKTEAASHIVQGLRNSIRHAREIARSLYPVTLEKGGLKAALEDLSDHWRRRSGVELSLELPASERLETEEALHLYRIIQEAVSNSVRHGRARKIRVRLAEEAEGSRSLEILDDGAGPAEGWDKTQGMGLHTMEYRARMLNGDLRFERNPLGGARVSCYYRNP